MITEHASERLIGRYLAGDAAIADDQVWALEVHLESCADCRRRLAEAGAPTLTGVLGQVWTTIEPDLAVPPAPPRRRWAGLLSRWATPAVLAWAVMVVVVVALAALAAPLSDDVPLIQLVSPVLPVVGVFAAWSRGTDPAAELIAATPRAGLELVLRRTLAVLGVVIPVLLLEGLVTGDPIGPALLPSFALTATTLALGGIIGVSRAAGVVGAGWVVLFAAPRVLADGVPPVLRPELLPAWAGLLAVAAVVVILRRTEYARLGFSRR